MTNLHITQPNAFELADVLPPSLTRYANIYFYPSMILILFSSLELYQPKQDSIVGGNMNVLQNKIANLTQYVISSLFFLLSFFLSLFFLLLPTFPLPFTYAYLCSLRCGRDMANEWMKFTPNLQSLDINTRDSVQKDSLSLLQQIKEHTYHCFFLLLSLLLIPLFFQFSKLV